MKQFLCDATDCMKVMELPTIVVTMSVTPQDGDDEDEAYDEFSHFCSIQCMVDWGMGLLMDHADDITA